MRRAATPAIIALAVVIAAVVIRPLLARPTGSQPPKASLTAASLEGGAQFEADFDAFPSNDADGRLVAYGWRQHGTPCAGISFDLVPPALRGLRIMFWFT